MAIWNRQVFRLAGIKPAGLHIFHIIIQSLQDRLVIKPPPQFRDFALSFSQRNLRIHDVNKHLLNLRAHFMYVYIRSIEPVH